MRRPVKPTIYTHVKYGLNIYPPYAAKSQVDYSPLIPERRMLGFLPPLLTTAPSPPIRPKLADPPAGFVRTLHAAPAAYPRQLRQAHGANSRFSKPFQEGAPAVKESRAAEAERLADEIGRVVNRRYDAQEWRLEEAELAKPAKLWNSVERWRREKPTGGYTIVCTHAGGLLKEHWHMRNIIERAPVSLATQFGSGERITHEYSVQIDDIWLLDDFVHNQSVDLNAGRRGDVHTWEDTGRDVLNFIQHVLPSTDTGTEAPWDMGWNERPVRRNKVIGMGHSFGGAAIIHAAHARPDLFDALFLVDPMGSPIYFPQFMYYYRQVEGYLLAQFCLKRRDVWPSAEFARKVLRALAFFQPWDQEQFDVYMTHGIMPTRPSQTGKVHSPRPRDPITHEMVWRAPRSRNERILDVGHLITQEQPHRLADSLWRFLCTLDAGEWDTPDIKLGSKL